ncbi:uncharacterized protein B0P05DRAFT_237095 [Gilbertella persicaria]|uniref:uncharacterized protein n=1 Tax=Gilbertella persicaria TaxID=101096 RepID=UPI002220FAD0|nr:uncharacterized protein B0P05DRAFT_237095 [Gilbertella persicaria]KAI8063719.1 hypothetical protein B0P05DRAFT_237095 [Gilbertella persicaria]
MSVYDADNNDYEWDDITPSLQDQIFDELDSQVDFFREETNDINVPLDLTDSKSAFDVFLDQLLQIPFKNKPAAKKKKIPLGEISVNQMTNTKPVDDKVKEKVHDSQEEAIWGDIDADLLSNMDMIISNEKKTEPFKGFSTASGKALKPPSKEAMQKAIQSLKEDHELPHMPHEQVPTMKGFQTASGKSLKPVSEESKKKALSIFQELEESKPVQPTSFMTASKKPIKEPSIQSKQNAKKLFEDLQEFKETKRPLDQPLSADNRYESVLKQFGGFKRGYSEESITVSDQAKRRAVSLFEKDSTVPSDDVSLKSVSTVPEMPVNVSLKPTPKTPLVKRNKRIPAIQKQNKPFKSPIIRSNIELTKAAVSNNRNAIKARGNSVFDLTVPNNRYTLSSLGLPLQYTKEQLLSKQIPISVIYMTVQSAKKYVFDDDWGPKKAEQDMIQKGCLPHCLSFAWVENHYTLIVWKMACLIRSYPDQFRDCWDKQRVLDQLLYRYEREINMGIVL